MTRYTAEQIDQIKKDIIGKTVDDFSYEEEGDYFMLEFENGEIAFRFMADL